MSRKKAANEVVSLVPRKTHIVFTQRTLAFTAGLKRSGKPVRQLALVTFTYFSPIAVTTSAIATPIIILPHPVLCQAGSLFVALLIAMSMVADSLKVSSPASLRISRKAISFSISAMSS